VHDDETSYYNSNNVKYYTTKEQNS
jgi:hypothetical protein